DIQLRRDGADPFQLQAGVRGLAALRDFRFGDLHRAVDFAQVEYGGGRAPVLRWRLVLDAGLPLLAAQRPQALAMAGIGLGQERLGIADVRQQAGHDLVHQAEPQRIGAVIAVRGAVFPGLDFVVAPAGQQDPVAPAHLVLYVDAQLLDPVGGDRLARRRFVVALVDRVVDVDRRQPGVVVDARARVPVAQEVHAHQQLVRDRPGRELALQVLVGRQDLRAVLPEIAGPGQD